MQRDTERFVDAIMGCDDEGLRTWLESLSDALGDDDFADFFNTATGEYPEEDDDEE